MRTNIESVRSAVWLALMLGVAAGCSGGSGGMDDAGVDPDAGDQDLCATDNGGCDALTTCSDDTGSVVCGACPSGYDGDGDAGCTDIDECSLDSDDCAQTCTNTAGSFTCGCNTGYALGDDGTSCDDIDECDADTDGCAGTCTNTDGGFTCGCESGYALGDDGTSCADVDECTDGTDGCEGTCANTDGGFTCGCEGGAVLGDDGTSCVAPPAIYYRNFNAAVRRVAADGSGDAEWNAGIGSNLAFDPETGTVFFDRENSATITRANPDGSNAVDVVTGIDYSLGGIAIDSPMGKLYWVDFNGRILRADLDGSNQEVVLMGLSGNPQGIAIDSVNQKVYWGQYNGGSFQRANLDGTSIEAVIPSGLNQPTDIEVDPVGGKIYYCDRSATLYVADLDGSNAGTLVGEQGFIQNIAIAPSEGRIYFGSGGGIRSADMSDGGNITDVLASAGSPWGLALSFQ